MLSTPTPINAGEIDLFFEELNDFCQQQKSKEMVYFGIEEICNIAFAETYRSIVDFEFTNKHIRDLLVCQMEALQSYSPNAAVYLPFFINVLSKKTINLNHDKFMNAINPATNEAINDIISSQFEHSSILHPEDFKSIFEANGFMSSFSIKKSNSFHNACVFDSGLTINCNLYSGFFKKNKSTIEFQYPQIVIYDGYIKDVSEINLILQTSLEKDVPFLIFAKGASHDVLNTCAVNLDLKKCKVCIIDPGPIFWKDQAQQLYNILEISPYGDVTGRLLNNFKLESNSNTTVLIKQNEVFIKGDAFDLNSNAKTTFFLNDQSWAKRGLIFDQLNFFASTMQQTATCGVINNQSFYDITGITINEVTGLSNTFHPAFSVIRALKEAETIINKIVNIGYFIRLKR